MSHNSKRKKPPRQGAKREPTLKLHKSSRQWYVCIKGKFHYFGLDEEEAREEWYRVKTDLLAGRHRPPKHRPILTVGKLCNLFMDFKDREKELGSLGAYTHKDWELTTDKIVDCFGEGRSVESLTPEDFLQYKSYLGRTIKSLQSLGYLISRAKSVFDYAYNNDLIDRPVKYGSGFRGPRQAAVRKQKKAKETKHGKKLFTPGQVLALMKAANPHLRAMIGLGINFGFNCADCGTLPLVAIDWERGVINFARNKTAVEREYLPLWPETFQYLKDSLAMRPAPIVPDDPEELPADDLVFVTRTGLSYHDRRRKRNPIVLNFGKLIRREDIYRPNLSFTTLRHTFQTTAENLTSDPIAVKAVMGHVDPSISAEYRHDVAQERIDRVVDSMHDWLFGEKNMSDVAGYFMPWVRS